MPDLEDLKKQLERIRSIGSAIGAFDSFQTTDLGPVGSQTAVGDVLAKLKVMAHDMFVSNEFYELVCGLSEQTLEGPCNKIVQTLKRVIELEKPIPSDLVEQISKHSTQANKTWIRARETKDFSLFAPDLEVMIDLQRKKASCYDGRFATPYDALIAGYDSDLTVAFLDPLFREAGEFLVSLMERVKDKEKPEDGFLNGNFNHAAQLEVSKIVLETIGLDLSKTLFVTATHPLTNGIIGGGLVLISTRTTSYLPDSVLGTVHEGGHGLLERFVQPPFAQLSNITGMSMSVHESTSRFWENHVARSRGFVRYLLKLFKSRFPLQFEKVNEDMLFRALNSVKPGFIRVNADQCTYLTHILLRYEIESKIVNGEISVNEIPDIWNELMKKYLGLVPEDPSMGYLQDVHWAFGYFGYFPTYQVGNWLAAMLEEWVIKNCGADGVMFGPDHVEGVLDFLKEKYYSDATVLTTTEAVCRMTGNTTIDLEPWKRHQLSLVEAVYD